MNARRAAALLSLVVVALPGCGTTVPSSGTAAAPVSQPSSLGGVAAPPGGAVPASAAGPGGAAAVGPGSQSTSTSAGGGAAGAGPVAGPPAADVKVVGGRAVVKIGVTYLKGLD